VKFESADSSGLRASRFTIVDSLLNLLHSEVGLSYIIYVAMSYSIYSNKCFCCDASVFFGQVAVTRQNMHHNNKRLKCNWKSDSAFFSQASPN
jgi:hypothetical protein